MGNNALLTEAEPGPPGPTHTAGRSLSTLDQPVLRSLSLPSLGFQDLEPRPHLQSLPMFENDAEIRTLPRWQETLW